MISLNKTTNEIKLLTKWLGIVVGGALLLYIIYIVGGVVKELVSPTPPPPPTVTFGKLPTVVFPEGNDGSQNSYSLNTVSGKLPSFSDRASVYKINNAEPNLLALQRAKDKVEKIGFTNSPMALSATKYIWTDPQLQSRTFTSEILNFNFILRENYQNNTTILSGVNLPTEKTAIGTFTNFLTQLSSLPPDIDKTKTQTSLLAIDNGELKESTSFSNSQIIRVDMYQNDVDKLSLYYENPPGSSIAGLIAGGVHDGQVVYADYFHQNITEVSATYPIISSNEAWEKLKKGEAYIPNPSSSNTIQIKDIKLGYFASNSKQEYLMPIIVFEGDNNFFAYVTAVKSDWIIK